MPAPYLEIILDDTLAGRRLSYGMQVNAVMSLEDAAENLATEFFPMVEGTPWGDFFTINALLSARFFTHDQGSHCCSWGGKNTPEKFIRGMKLCGQRLDDFARKWAADAAKSEVRT